MQLSITLKSGKFKGYMWVYKFALLSLKNNRWKASAAPIFKTGQKYSVGQPYSDLWGNSRANHLGLHFWTPGERRSYLKTYFCLAETFALPIELHQSSCVSAFRKQLYVSTAYIMNALVIQKLEVGGICRRALGSFYDIMFILYLSEK